MTALQTGAVLACVKIVCNGIATLPLHVYEKQVRENGRAAKQLAQDHSYYNLLRALPNEEMTSHTWRSVMMMHMLLWGNGYTEMQRDKGNRIVALWPRNPARTRPVRLTHSARIEGTLFPRGKLVYHTSETMGDEISAQDDTQNQMAPERIILSEDILHIPGLSLDGRLGQSTVYLARQIIGLSLATEKFGAKFFGNGAVPRGILEVPGVLETKAIETLRRSWQEAHGGENSHKTAVLEQGVKYTPIGIDPEKSQFLETRKHQSIEIAAVFNVPPHMIGESTERSKSSVEQTSIEFLNYCLNPWIDAYEQEIKRKMFPPSQPKQAMFFAKFDTNRLLYPDAATRSAYYTGGKNTGWLNTNDIHEHEDLNPVEDGSGEVYWAPVNMVDAATGMLVGQTLKSMAAQSIAQAAGNPKPTPTSAPAVEKVQGGAPQNKKNAPKKPKAKPSNPKGKPSGKAKRTSDVTRLSGVYYPLLLDSFNRFLSRKEKDEESFNRCMAPAVKSIAGVIYGEVVEPVNHENIFPSDFMPVMNAYLSGMYGKAVDVTPELRLTHAHSETLRIVETLFDLMEERYNPNHATQGRNPEGTWNDGSNPFYVMRHGSTDDDINGLWSGWGSISLNDQGKEEVDGAIQSLVGLGIRRIVCSNLERARETAQRVANALLVPLTVDTRLNALDLGVFAGQNEETYASGLQLYFDNPTVGIPGGEVVNDYIARTDGAMDDIRGTNDSTGPILVIAHSSTICTYVAGARNLEDCSAMLSPAGVLRFNNDKMAVVHGDLTEADAA